MEEHLPEDLQPDLLEALRQQMDSEETAFVRQTFERLASGGSADEEAALHAMASVLLWEINTMMATGNPFDLEHYRTELEQLAPTDHS